MVRDPALPSPSQAAPDQAPNWYFVARNCITFDAA
jgi:hypothetical protein